MSTRRDFLKHSTLVALAPSVPAFLRCTARSAEPERDDRVLVVIQLDGGNDGINTVVPFRDEGYAKNRDKLRLAEDRIIKLDKEVGLHPAMRAAAGLVEDGRLAIVQGVGYPNPNRSHDVSMAIWQTARFDSAEHKGFGWIGRAMDEAPRPKAGAPASLLAGDDKLPRAILGRRSIASSLNGLDELVMTREPTKTAKGGPSDDLAAFVRRTSLDAYTTAALLAEVSHQTKGSASATYPETKLAERLRLIAQLIKAGLGTRVYYAVQPGYDTHYLQLPGHAQLLGELSGALAAFLNDLAGAKLADRVLVLCFSEFGRRVQENASQGTDHGTAGPVFLAGPKVKSGLHATAPRLTDLVDGDLKMSVDFRQVYATVLERWLSIASQRLLGERFEPLPVVSS